MRPSVSVIIPTFNRPERLARALHSVAAQTVGHENVEAVVINDGGPSVAHVVQAQNETFPVRLVELEHSGGVSKARNVAIDIAEGKYIAFLDDDDLFLPDHLSSALAVLERGEVGFTYLGAVVSDIWLDSMPADMSRFPLKAYQWNAQVLQVANYLHTGSVVCRNFKDTPLRFDPALTVCEDWDLWLALTDRYGAASGNKITCVYHQVRDFVGLVSAGQGGADRQFQNAYKYIYNKRPTSDPFVAASRQWLLDLEESRCNLVLEGRKFNYSFDDVLKYLYVHMARQKMPDHRHFGQFFRA